MVMTSSKTLLKSTPDKIILESVKDPDLKDSGFFHDQELRPILVELRDALHQHIEHLRTRFTDYPFVVEP